jgi:FkbM family methyltransferase
MSSALRTVRSLAARAFHRFKQSPAEAAWRRIVAVGEHAPRYTAGRLTLLGLDLEYPDAVSLAPQWHDLFVRETLAFDADSSAPRVLDCGANIGLASLWIKRQYGSARVTAFEADPAIAEILARNLARNGAGDVDVVPAAVWREGGQVAFRQEGSDSGAIDGVAADTRGTALSVPAVRLRDVVAAEAIDLLKLDIEGAELAVLEDLEDALAGVRALHVEVHDFDPAARLLPRCLLLLERAGYVYALDDFGVARWRPGAVRRGPFRHAVPSWVVLVRAWRD